MVLLLLSFSPAPSPGWVGKEPNRVLRKLLRGAVVMGMELNEEWVINCGLGNILVKV